MDDDKIIIIIMGLALAALLLFKWRKTPEKIVIRAPTPAIEPAIETTRDECSCD